MVQCADRDLSVPVYNMLKPYIKCMADVCRQFPEHQEQSYWSSMAEWAKFGRRLLAVTMLMEGHVRFVELKLLNDELAPIIVNSLIPIVLSLMSQSYTVTFEMNGWSARPINRDDMSISTRFCKIIDQWDSILRSLLRLSPVSCGLRENLRLSKRMTRACLATFSSG
jgi:hypothetical protein